MSGSQFAPRRPRGSDGIEPTEGTDKVTLRGFVVGHTTAAYGRVVDCRSGRSFFLHATDCVAGMLPPMHAEVTFIARETDRGPRATEAAVVGMFEPPPGVTFEEMRLRCRMCSQVFSWSIAEQVTHLVLRYENRPSTCPDCRQARRLASRGYA